MSSAFESILIQKDMDDMLQRVVIHLSSGSCAHSMWCQKNWPPFCSYVLWTYQVDDGYSWRWKWILILALGHGWNFYAWGSTAKYDTGIPLVGWLKICSSSKKDTSSISAMSRSFYFYPRLSPLRRYYSRDHNFCEFQLANRWTSCVWYNKLWVLSKYTACHSRI